jgi:hypothetical protein
VSGRFCQRLQKTIQFLEYNDENIMSNMRKSTYPFSFQSARISGSHQEWLVIAIGFEIRQAQIKGDQQPYSQATAAGLEQYSNCTGLGFSGI